SELIAMGSARKTVMDLPTGGEAEIEEREDNRFEDEHDLDRDGINTDPLMREVWLLEEYVRTDYDGDDSAELRKVQRVGSTILYNGAVECDPWAAVCPYPFPHKFYGQSDADKVVDIQRVKSTLWRQTLDNLYLTNNPQKELPQGAERDDGSTMNALLEPEIGGIVPTKA